MVSSSGFTNMSSSISVDDNLGYVAFQVPFHSPKLIYFFQGHVFCLFGLSFTLEDFFKRPIILDFLLNVETIQ